MPVNVKLLKKVRKLIADEPRRLKMGVWGRKVNSSDRIKPPCGTVACLAGWTILASQPRKEWKNIIGDAEWNINNFARQKSEYIPVYPVEEFAARLLGLPSKDCPFRNMSWKVPEVLAWIDRQIDAASK